VTGCWCGYLSGVKCRLDKHVVQLMPLRVCVCVAGVAEAGSGSAGANDADDEEMEVIACICNIYRDEGLMIQCDTCQVRLSQPACTLTVSACCPPTSVCPSVCPLYVCVWSVCMSACISACLSACRSGSTVTVLAWCPPTSITTSVNAATHDPSLRYHRTRRTARLLASHIYLRLFTQLRPPASRYVTLDH